MSRRRTSTTKDEPGATLPAVVHRVITESADEAWQRWSQERAEQARQQHLAETAAAKAETERGIYPVEIARNVAQTYAHAACPEWRYLKDLIGREFGSILREQPEMRQRDVRARERIIVALFDALPRHMHGALGELRTVLELVTVAREAAAFLIGFEIGREAGHRAALRDPRVMLAPTADRKHLEGHEHPGSSGPLRLTLGDE